MYPHKDRAHNLSKQSSVGLQLCYFLPARWALYPANCLSLPVQLSEYSLSANTSRWDLHQLMAANRQPNFRNTETIGSQGTKHSLIRRKRLESDLWTHSTCVRNISQIPMYLTPVWGGTNQTRHRRGRIRRGEETPHREPVGWRSRSLTWLPTVYRTCCEKFAKSHAMANNSCSCDKKLACEKRIFILLRFFAEGLLERKATSVGKF